MLCVILRGVDVAVDNYVEITDAMNTLFRLSFLILILILINTSTVAAQSLRISAAASMTDVIKELIASFQITHPEIKIVPNFGPSGGLAKQIYLGAPADIFISANSKWMDYLKMHKRIKASSLTILAHNTLVFVGDPKYSLSTLSHLNQLDQIGLGSPANVPAGHYAKQVLEQLGLYNTLLQDGKLVMAKDVRQALIYADRGETDGSFIYKSDTRLASQAVILYEIPIEMHAQINYPLALTLSGNSKREARLFYEHALSEDAAIILVKYGFTLPQT